MADRYWVGGSGTWDTTSTANWSASSGGASGASAPTTADVVFLNANSGAVTVTLGEDVPCLRLTCTGFTGTLDFVTYKISVSGTGVLVTQSTTMTVSGTPLIELTNSSATSRTLSITNVTEANAISYNVTAGTGGFANTNIAGIKNLDFTGFSGNWNNNSSNIFGNLTLSTTMTLSSGSTVRSFVATSGVNQITTNGKTVDFPMFFDGPGGTVAFQDALTQGATRSFNIRSCTVQLKDGVTSTVGSLSTATTATRQLTSTLAGSQATLSQASGTVNVSNLTIKDINATGGATFNAFTTNGNVDAGNNTGWDFIAQLGKYIYTRRKNKRILL